MDEASRTGEQGLIGEVGYAVSDVNSGGKVAVHGNIGMPARKAIFPRAKGSG